MFQPFISAVQSMCIALAPVVTVPGFVFLLLLIEGGESGGIVGLDAWNGDLCQCLVIMLDGGSSMPAYIHIFCLPRGL